MCLRTTITLHRRNNTRALRTPTPRWRCHNSLSHWRQSQINSWLDEQCFYRRPIGRAWGNLWWHCQWNFFADVLVWWKLCSTSWSLCEVRVLTLHMNSFSFRNSINKVRQYLRTIFTRSLWSPVDFITGDFNMCANRLIDNWILILGDQCTVALQLRYSWRCDPCYEPTTTPDHIQQFIFHHCPGSSPTYDRRSWWFWHWLHVMHLHLLLQATTQGWKTKATFGQFCTCAWLYT